MPDYENDLQINSFNLEEEWLKQASLYFHYSKLQADARRDYDLEKDNVEMVRAETAHDVRNNPKEYDLEKPTVDAVNAVVVTDDKYIDAVAEMNEARHAYEVLSGMVKALEHKRAALENLVRIRSSRIHAEPHVDADTQSDFNKQTSEEVKSEIRRRRGAKNRGA